MAAPDFTEPFRSMVETRFATEWTAEYPNIPIEFDNVPFKQPSTTSWVKFTFLQNPASSKTIGRQMLIRTDGFLQIDVIERKEKGLVAARKMAEYAANIFAFQKFKTAEITASFDEKHVNMQPTSDQFVRVMARVFFIYDGFALREGVQVLN